MGQTLREAEWFNWGGRKEKRRSILEAQHISQQTRCRAAPAAQEASVRAVKPPLCLLQELNSNSVPSI